MDPSPDCFVGYETTIAEPLALQGELPADLEERCLEAVSVPVRWMTDTEFATNSHAWCTRPGAVPGDHLRRCFDVPLEEPLQIIAGIRFKGGDAEKPFVQVEARSRALASAEDVEGIRRVLAPEFQIFEPRWLRLFLSRAEEARIGRDTATADQRVVVGRVAAVRALPIPKVSVSLTARLAQDLSWYPELEQEYDRFRSSAPEIVSESVQIAERSELEDLVGESLLEFLVDGEWAGVFAATRAHQVGLPTFEVVEEFLMGQFRGFGLGPAAQRAAVDLLPASDDEYIYGTIIEQNVPSLRTALRNGRLDLGGFFFYPWP